MIAETRRATGMHEALHICAPNACHANSYKLDDTAVMPMPGGACRYHSPAIISQHATHLPPVPYCLPACHTLTSPIVSLSMPHTSHQSHTSSQHAKHLPPVPYFLPACHHTSHMSHAYCIICIYRDSNLPSLHAGCHKQLSSCLLT